MTKQVATKISQDVLDQLKNSQPVEDTFQRVQLPKLGMFSQDKKEGKGKAMKVVSEAGTFYIERKTDELDEETGKNIYEKTEIGTTIDGTILYNRKKLSFYDEPNSSYISSSIYDTDTEVVSLWSKGKEVLKGTEAQLKEEYMFTDTDGKRKSRLKNIRVLYVLHEGELFQMEIGGTSMFAFSKYNQAVRPSVAAIVTTFFSEPQTKGSNEYNQMTFTKARDLTQEEALEVLGYVQEIQGAIKAEKEFFGKKEVTPSNVVHPDFEEDNQLAIDAAKKF